MSATLIFVGVIVLLAVVIIARTVNIIQQGYVGIVKRVGEFHSVRQPGITYELTALTSDHSRAVIEYIRRAPGEEPLAVAEAFEVRNGKIVHSVVYHFG